MWTRLKKLNRDRRTPLILAAAVLAVLAIIALVRNTENSSLPAPAPTESGVTPAAPQQAQSSAVETDPVLELFNPSEASLSEQVSESMLKNRMEEAMTTSFILKRCGLVSDAEYSETYQALMLYAQRMQPGLSPAQLQENFSATVASASASYGLIYARMNCNTPELQLAAQQIAGWRHAILNPPQQ